ncbi:MAG TPA: NnrU family protein [Polyangiaceae bacterium]|nr:NnrU family protein [Polyangiaceae bacterium]
MIQLGLAAALWFALHAGIAGSGLRRVLIARIGEKAYRGVFSLLSVVTLVFLVHAYGAAPCVPLWSVPDWFRWLPISSMPFALFLLVGAFSVPNPTSVGGEALLARKVEARGVLRITRHPFLWAAALWSTVHLLVSGTLTGLLFFGSIGLTALQGTRDIDEKRRRAQPLEFEALREKTSNLPFAALIRGRNRLVWRELALPFVLAMALLLGILSQHQRWFHVSPWPFA